MPVVVLSGVALFFLREDRAAIDKEARDRAAALMPEAARRMSQRLVETVRPFPAPIDYAPLPVPPAKVDVRANAELVRLQQSGSAQRLLELARQSPAVLTGSGSPLADIAILSAMRTVKPGALPALLLPDLEHQVRERPSFLTPELLSEASRVLGSGPVQPLIDAWRRDEQRREMLRLAPGCSVWAEKFFVMCGEGGRLLVPEDQIIFQIVRSEAKNLPAYASAAIEVAGRRWPSHPDVLAQTSAIAKTGVDLPFRAFIVVQNRDVLYAGFRWRMWLLTGLVICAATTALLGVLNLWRTLHRQAQLAEMKSNFISAVSHELRAPIGAVQLLAENLERGKAQGAQQQEHVNLIVQQCRRLSTLIDNVLDFSRMDSGRRRYTFEPVAPMPLLHDSIALMEPYATERQVTLALVPPENGAASLRPKWDHHAIEQSLVNLLDNAIKHSPEGATVQVELDHPTPDSLRIWISDRGPGIPREEHQKIFDLFYRRGSELRRETKGAGIGLSIVKHAAEAHGGRVLLESAPGKGSRFGLDLPLEPHA